MSTILETNNITKIYGKQKAVDSVSILIKQGDIYGLIGRNGAGKTTLMRMVAGLARPTDGKYSLFGKDELDAKLVMPRIGCLIENTGIYPNLTGFEHLRLKALAIGQNEPGLEKKLLEIVGLDEVGKKKVKQFSLGMKQRLGIALALVGNPDLVILDEPINGLDPQGIVEIRNTIESLNREEGITFIISSHILGELARLASRFGIIDQGRLVEEINRSDLEQKSRDRIELITPQASQAVVALDQINIMDYQLISENEIYIYEEVNRTGDIALTLAQNEIPIESLTVHKNTLEDYYLQLTGYANQPMQNEVPYV
ncbi:MAG: ATP-binding cassette domain-containing protein [Clostridiaceae bacterium]|jgi:ABC-2 type transport system ATP-binding protein|nr:ATP-binding cassette domain-containing protein [Bacillota bacterium]NLN52195.1 ATP-binding cassette domain-containing protein [Clostridiaceae bacterium]